MRAETNAMLRASALSLGALLAVQSALAQAPRDDAAAGASTQRLARLESIYVDKIAVEGSTVFSDAELMAMTAAYENRSVSLEELHALRHALSQAYVERGYVSSGVVIPDQSVTGGVVVLQAIEGDLTEIAVQGNHRFREEAIAKRVAHHVDEPLDINDLRTTLEVLREDPLVERIDAQLLPGEAPGQSYLRLGITERPPLEIEVAASNDRPTSVGEDRATIGIAYRGLIGNGDVLSGRFGFTDGVEDNQLGYRVPLTAGGVLFDVQLSDQQTDIVEEPFRAIDIESRLKSASFTASYPFINDYASKLTGILGFEHKHSESTLLDLPFSFSPGDVDGRAQGSAISAGMEWTRRQPTRAWSARGTMQIGVDALDATVNPSGPDSEFVTLLGQVQFLQTFADGSRLLARGLVQLAHDPLLAMYKLPVGGRYTVRGYRENQFVRDNGTVVSVEYQLPVAVDEAGRPRGNVYVAVFGDYGVSWDEDAARLTSDKERIASVGLGVLWDPVSWLHAELYWGMDAHDQGTGSSSLQDQGIHYRVSFSKSF
jgi:hemolysin activation/secretion protein